MAKLTSTYTFAVMEVSPVAYEEIKKKLEEAGYQHAIRDGLLDMHGIALGLEEKPGDCLNYREYGLLCVRGKGHPGPCGNTLDEVTSI